jgi:chromate transporter
VFALALLYADYAASPGVRAAVTGVGIAGGGLFIGTAWKLARPLARKPWALALAVACLGVIAFGRVSLFVVLPVAALAGVLGARKDLI